MATDTITAALRCLEIFRGLKPLQIDEIARAAERIVFRDGQIIIEAGEPGDGAVVLISGTAVALAEHVPGAPARLVETGSLLGDLAMLIEHDYAVTVVARGQVHALKITRVCLHALMRADPGLADHFVTRIASRLTRVAVELRRIDQALASAGEMAQGLH